MRIRAAVLRSHGEPLKIEPLELDAPRDDEVLVRIVATGICHTDIGLRNDWDEADGPAVLGHEGAGIVERCGKRIKSFRQGDHVVLSYQSCGACAQCLAGRPWSCQRFREANFGFARLDGSHAFLHSEVKGHFFGQSSFATYCLATERNTVEVPEDLDLAILAPLGCGMQTGAGTVMNSLSMRSGESIAVFGTGAVGLAAIMAARVVGASTIVGVDINEKRLQVARELGATEVIDARQTNTAAAIGGRRFDYTMDTTGDEQSLRQAVEWLKPGGVAALLTGADSPILPTESQRVFQVIQGNSVPQDFIPRLIGLYRDGQFPFDRLIKVYDFEDINRAIADAQQGETIKPVLRLPSISA
jgi:aryl-alcohol dehydrogenase